MLGPRASFFIKGVVCKGVIAGLEVGGMQSVEMGTRTGKARCGGASLCRRGR